MTRSATTSTAPDRPAQDRPGAAPLPLKPWRFWSVLAAILVAASIQRGVLLSDYVAHNPFAASPRSDALTYWNWAGRIASGEWSDGQPFLSAPLYPYLLGAVRAAGGSLTTVYVLQIALDLLTAALLALIGRRRLGEWAGLLAAALFVLLIDPASFSLRILAQTIQLPLVCLAWMALQAVQARPNGVRSALAGAALGVLALSYAPALICLPLAALWVCWIGGGRLRTIGRAAALLAGGAAAIAPAAIHNWRSSGELILISAQGGVTFAQGNAPASTGVYTPLPGVSIDRERQNADARRVFRHETGRDGSWAEVSRHFLQRGLSVLRSNPAATAALFARKLWWYVSGQTYGDIYTPVLERSEGLTRSLWLAPLPSPWLIPAAVFSLVAWIGAPRKRFPELLFAAVPLLISLAFFYSPRYRFPALPVVCVAAAATCARAARYRARPFAAWVAALALAAGPATTWINAAAGFDRPDAYRAEFRNSVGVALDSRGDVASAAEWFRKAMVSQPDFAEARANLGDALARLGRIDEALAELVRAVQLDPERAVSHDQFGRALAQARRLDEATSQFETAVRLSPESPEFRTNLGNAYRLAGDLRRAEEQYRAALRLAPGDATAHASLGSVLAQTQRTDEALSEFRAAVAARPDWAQPRAQLGLLLAARGDREGAMHALREALTLAERQGAAELAQAIRERLLEIERGGAGNP